MPHWEIAKEDVVLHGAKVLLDRANTPGHKEWILCRGCVFIQQGEAWLNLESLEALPTQ